jgi:ribonuclease Z
MRQLFEPRLVNDRFGDPALLVDLGDEGRALLFDLGDVRRLPPRLMLRISHVFVSHTHMDHFAGFDGLLRVVLGRKERLVLTGGPDFVAQLEHRLRSYSWNVVHRYAVPLQLEAREIGLGGQGRRASFSSREGFARAEDATFTQAGGVIHDEALLRVRACFVDHEMPCLAFALEEKPRPRVDRVRLASLGLATGVWLRRLREAVGRGEPPDTPIQLRWRDAAGEHDQVRRLGELAGVLRKPAAGRRIGYVTDLRDSAANRQALQALLAGVDDLFIESVFLQTDGDHAARKNHLTAAQAGRIARDLGAHRVEPFHFSPRYSGREGELERELKVAWAGDA